MLQYEKINVSEEIDVNSDAFSVLMVKKTVLSATPTNTVCLFRILSY